MEISKTTIKNNHYLEKFVEMFVEVVYNEKRHVLSITLSKHNGY